MTLEGKVVLITGASEGIGAACAEVLRSRGCRLVLAARSEAKLRAAAKGGDLVVAVDLRDAQAREHLLAETVRHFGRIDVLLNNAGVGLYAPSHTTPLDEARALWELNFFATFHLAQLAAEQMKRSGGGVIVNVGSIAGKITLPWFTLYSASKFAVGSLTEGLRMELRSHGIHCMTVCPGYVKTRFQQNVMQGRPPNLSGASRRWAITAEKCARDIVRGLERQSKTVVTPASGWLLIGFQRLFPGFIERRLEAIYRKQDLHP